jgi:hypothetical protein
MAPASANSHQAIRRCCALRFATTTPSRRGRD